MEVVSDTRKYDDIINLPHHVSMNHRRMSLLDRAAQFAPFAALSGYEEAVIETRRLTDKRRELDESEKEKLDDRLQIIKDSLEMHPIVEITFFVPDERKSGGAYVTSTGYIKKINTYKSMLIIDDGTEIPIKEIVDVEGEIFKFMDD